ncbi:MAG: hypothetical protein HYW97_00805, partial [Candidatus Wildermuthbacteria bacterium]|nr:hypothetical protein [Candidatus Wildermuthbacteria bacterium]
MLDISRSTTTNSLFASTLTVSGALVSISDTSTQTTGTLTHSADVLALTQNYGTTTGAILSLTPPSTTNAGGALEAINIGSITTSSGTDLALTFGTGWDTDINATTSLEIGIGGTNELTLTATALSPSTDSGSDLGTSSSQFADLYLDGGNINLDNATDIDIDDNTASALTVTAGADTYFLITTSTGAEVVTLNNIEAGTMNIGTTNVTRTLN